MISLIWAEDENGLIGRDGKLPWHKYKENNRNTPVFQG